jgi:hypothetical protein
MEAWLKIKIFAAPPMVIGPSGIQIGSGSAVTS